jgi:hypothetical protein
MVTRHQENLKADGTTVLAETSFLMTLLWVLLGVGIGTAATVVYLTNRSIVPPIRRTSRLDCVVHHLGLALGGRPAASVAKRLMLPVSNDTILRVVRARACPRTEPLNVVDIDDWAFRRNHSYGKIVCDLERRRIVTLFPIERWQQLGLGSLVIPALPFYLRSW